MTCKDCIHSKVCRDYIAYQLDNALSTNDVYFDFICDDFKDRAKFMFNKYFDYQSNELNDFAIVSTLKLLAEDYKNGEIIEVKNELQEIVNAITMSIKGV